jgi:hypothetical protein
MTAIRSPPLLSVNDAGIRPAARAGDTASTLPGTADYSVGTVWGSKNLSLYLLDRVRGRFEVPIWARSDRPGSGNCWFPNARHNDQVDSTSQALHYLARRTAPLLPNLDGVNHDGGPALTFWDERADRIRPHCASPMTGAGRELPVNSPPDCARTRCLHIARERRSFGLCHQHRSRR